MTENISGNTPERITFKHMLGILAGIFNLEKGLFHTMWELTIRPGEALRKYLFEDRSKFLNPLRFLFLSSAVATLLNVSYLMSEQTLKENLRIKVEQEAQLNPEKIDAQKQMIISEMFAFISSNQNLFILVFPLLAALLTIFLFRKNRYYFGEHLAINSFAMAYMNVVYILMFPLIYFTTWAVFIYYILSYVFLVWVYLNVYSRKRFAGVMYASMVAGLVNAFYFIIILLIIVVFMISKFSEMSADIN